MNNLHRELAPVSAGAWEQIDQEAARTLKRYLSARRVVDVVGPQGAGCSAVGTGHLRRIAAPGKGILAAQREARPLVELRVPFELSREALDSVERGANDPDLQPLKDAVRLIASAEDRAVFDGYAAGGIQGIREGSSNAAVALPSDLDDYPAAVAQAANRLRLAGVDGPYALLLGEQAYTALSGVTDDGYPVVRGIRELVEGGIVWAPAIEGGLMLSTRGGDHELHIGQDMSIGYLGHSETGVRLYLQETFTFLLLATEASVSLSPAPAKKRKAD